ncbi:MAG: methyltransferase [Archaeoglobaceae archaeon]
MLNVLNLDVEWLRECLMLEDFKTFVILDKCIKIGFFDILESPKAVEEISNSLNLNSRIVKAICEFFKSKGLLEEEGGRFMPSEISRTFFSRSSPFSLLDLFEMKEEEIENWLNIDRALKGEILRKESEFFKKRIIYLAKLALLKDLKIVFKISEYEEFRNAEKLLDLGGGHGLYAYAFTLLNGKLEATVFDLPEVVRTARDFLKPFSPERVRFVDGNFFKDDLGSGYDLVFSSFNPGGKRAELIPKIHRALKIGGIYVNRQYFPREFFTIEDLEWNLWGFEGLKKGFKAYTFEGDLSFEEYIDKLVENGFQILDLFGETYRVIVAKKLDQNI